LRLLAGARGHRFHPDQPLDPATIRRPGHELWILHPSGAPHEKLPPAAPSQVLLLDGSWREATQMMRRVGGWGRTVRLPMTVPSRYRLRAGPGAGNYSTVEALLFVLDSLGETAAHDALRAQFELHVYAGLRARGEKALADAYLATSPARDAFPELLAELDRRRPRG
jgi:DTW domain-containing protein YfiP